jgi:hypothetical protein
MFYPPDEFFKFSNNIKALGLRYGMEAEFGSYQLAIFNYNKKYRNPTCNKFYTISNHQYGAKFQGIKR